MINQHFFDFVPYKADNRGFSSPFFGGSDVLLQSLLCPAALAALGPAPVPQWEPGQTDGTGWHRPSF